ncbi:MAG TPA: hypothetical protein PLU35_10185 [Phycisphaerales bacterium]|nr:hypothetical protein [Phycisphaerales bacterium]
MTISESGVRPQPRPDESRANRDGPDAAPGSRESDLETGGRQDRRPHIATVVFLCVWAAWTALLIAIHVRDPGLHIGGWWNDSNVVNASRFFDRFGLGMTGGLPCIETALRDGKPGSVYATYPPGPYWIHEAVKRLGAGPIEGRSDIMVYRVVAQSAGSLGALLAFFVFSRIARSAPIGALAGCFYMLSVPFAGFSSMFRIDAYEIPLLFGLMACWLRFESATTRRRRIVWAGVTALLFFVDGWITFENVLIFGAFVAGRTLFRLRLKDLAGAAVVGLMPVLVLLIRVLHNGAALGGGWRAGLASLSGGAEKRAMGAMNADTLDRFFPRWLARLGWPWSGSPSLDYDRQFFYPALDPWVLAPAMLLGGALLAVWSRDSTRPARLAVVNGLLLLAGGSLWFALMTEHAFVHDFIVLLLMPGIALLMAGVCHGAAQSLRDRAARRSATVVAVPLLLVTLIAGFLSNLRYSDVLNQVFHLDDSVRQRVDRARTTFDHLALAGLAMGDVDRITIQPMFPVRAAALNRPFNFQIDMQTLPDGLAPDEALYIETWWPETKALAAEALRRFGLPGVVTPPPEFGVIFRGGSDGASPARVRLQEWFTLTSVRWAPTLDGRSRALALRIDGQFDQKRADRYVFTLRVIDQHGRQVDAKATRLSWSSVRDGRTGLVTLILASDVPVQGTVLRLDVWDTETAAFATMQVEQLPDWMRVSDDGRRLEWDG